MLDLPRSNLLIEKPFIFLRHGQTTTNAKGVVAGSLDVELSEKGREQALFARQKLDQRFEGVFASSLKRCIDTASLAAPDHSPTLLPCLVERHWGVWEGRYIPRHFEYQSTPPKGEAWEVFQSRMLEGLNMALGQTNAHTKPPLIVAHSGTYRVLRSIINGSPSGKRVANASPILFEPSAEGWRITPL